MGSPDPRQIDGLGGADMLTSKVAIVSKSTRPGMNVDYLFAQVDVAKPIVDTSLLVRQHAGRGRTVRGRNGHAAGPGQREPVGICGS